MELSVIFADSLVSLYIEFEYVKTDIHLANNLSKKITSPALKSTLATEQNKSTVNISFL